jgi:hypothetical protein
MKEVSMAVSPVSSEKITQYIQHLVTEKRISYLEAVIVLCEQRGWEPELVAPYLGDAVKSKLAEDAQRLHYIPRQPALPF